MDLNARWPRHRAFSCVKKTCQNKKLESPVLIQSEPMKALRGRLSDPLPRRHQAVGAARDTAPIVAGAVEAAERAGFDAKRVDALDGHRPVIGLARDLAIDAAGPLPVGLWLHVDQDRLALVVRGCIEHIAAQRGTAFRDPHRALAFGLPVADRRIGHLFFGLPLRPAPAAARVRPVLQPVEAAAEVAAAREWRPGEQAAVEAPAVAKRPATPVAPFEPASLLRDR